MNIDIICIGDIKEKYFLSAINEYEKRMKSYAKVNIIELKEEKIVNNPSQKDIDNLIDKEGKKILDKINERSFIIPLCIEGKQLDSVSLAKKIEDISINGYSDITFIIGGSYGLSEAVKSKGHFKLSFSKMTFPHQLMRVILMEQVYRSFRINNNEPYHK